MHETATHTVRLGELSWHRVREVKMKGDPAFNQIVQVPAPLTQSRKWKGKATRATEINHPRISLLEEQKERQTDRQADRQRDRE